MLNVKKKILSALLALLSIGGFMEVAHADKATCQQAFHKMYKEEKYRSIESKINYWLSVKSECGGNGAYEYQLGKLYTYAKAYDKAETTFLDGLKLNTQFSRDLKLGIAEIALHKSQFSDAFERFSSLQLEYPDWHIPYQKLGQLYIEADEQDKAIFNLEKSNQLKESADTYAALVITYYNVNRYDDSVAALDKAIRLNPKIARHRQAMYAAALSHFSQKRYRQSGYVLSVLLKQDPSVSDDKMFQKLYLQLEDYIK